MNSFEKPKDPIAEKENHSLENEDLLNDIREAFAEELEDLVEDPRFANLGLDEDLPDRVREGEKAGWSTQIKDVLARVGEEFGFGLDKIEELEDIFLDEEEVF